MINTKIIKTWIKVKDGIILSLNQSATQKMPKGAIAVPAKNQIVKGEHVSRYDQKTWIRQPNAIIFDTDENGKIIELKDIAPNELKKNHVVLTPRKNYIFMPGEPVNWYKDGVRIPDDELIKNGLRKDNRGTYYSKKDGSKIEVQQLDVLPGDEYVETPPDVLCPSWDGKKWIEDTRKSEPIRKEMKLSELNKRESALRSAAQEAMLEGAVLTDEVKKEWAALKKEKADLK